MGEVCVSYKIPTILLVGIKDLEGRWVVFLFFGGGGGGEPVFQVEV